MSKKQCEGKWIEKTPDFIWAYFNIGLLIGIFIGIIFALILETWYPLLTCTTTGLILGLIFAIKNPWNFASNPVVVEIVE